MTAVAAMRWRRLGLLFDAGKMLPPGYVGFAQAPQAVVLDDVVRVFFSSRTADVETNAYRSHVLFADFTPAMDRVLSVSSRPVLPLGDLGCFDEHGIFPMGMVRVGEDLYGYTCGWSRRVSVPVETAIGLAISHDQGRTFERVGKGPILGATLHEPFLVGDGHVRLVEGLFHMWYIFGTAWKRYPGIEAAERTYKIGHATSADGRSWKKDEGVQVIPDRLGPDESQALPSVIEIDGLFHMFFCFRESADFRTNPARGYRLGHATSTDLTSWIRSDGTATLDVDRDAWDSSMQCYPNAFESEGKIYLLYNGNEFGRHGFGAAVLVR